MGIILPTTKVAPECKSPKNLIIFSKPKIGKTSLLSTLDNCLILDLEGGTKYLNAMKVEAKSFEEIREIGKAIKEAGNPLSEGGWFLGELWPSKYAHLGTLCTKKRLQTRCGHAYMQ